MRRILFTGLSFFFGTQALLAQREDSLEIRKIADEVLVHGRAYDNLL